MMREGTIGPRRDHRGGPASSNASDISLRIVGAIRSASVCRFGDIVSATAISEDDLRVRLNAMVNIGLVRIEGDIGAEVFRLTVPGEEAARFSYFDL